MVPAGDLDRLHRDPAAEAGAFFAVVSWLQAVDPGSAGPVRVVVDDDRVRFTVSGNVELGMLEEVVEAMRDRTGAFGGELEVEREPHPDGGERMAAVRGTFPAGSQRPHSVPGWTAVVTDGPVASARLDALRVLVADDSFLVRDGVVRMLTAQPGLDVVGATADLPTTLAAVDEHRPDVVLTDIRMPPSRTDEGLRVATTAVAATRRSEWYC